MSAHDRQPVTRSGVALGGADVVVILIHGRFSSAESILTLAEHFPKGNISILAPNAKDGTWYPQRFIAPIESNEPWLSSALDRVDAMVHEAMRAGVPPERIVLCGFSQGACLALEYASRNPRHYGAVAGLSGALIGPLETLKPRPGSFEGAPVLMACAEEDTHIPIAHIRASEPILKGQGADLTTMIFPGAVHSIFHEEMEWLLQRWPK